MASGDRRASGGFVALIYIAFFAAVAGPTVVLVLLGLLGPDPYVLVPEGLDLYRDKALLRQEAEIETHVYDDAAAARSATDRYANSVAKSRAVKTLHEHRYVRDDNGHYELVLPIDNLLLRIEGRDRDHVDAVFADLPFLTENPEKNLAWVLVTEHLTGLLVGIAVYVVFLLVVFARLFSRAARVSPSVGVAALSAEELRRRLLALDELDLPFRVRESGGGRLVAEWRLVDEEWGARLQKGGLRLNHKIYLELDETRAIARAVQDTTRASWSKSPWSAAFGFAWSRGIVAYQAETGAGMGIVPDGDGWRLDETYRYRFVLGEIVQPVVGAIVGAGWEFRPVFTFFRPLGG